MRNIVIATKNKAKFKEIKRLFEGARFKILPLDAFPSVPRVVEDGSTFEENAVKKALVVSRHAGALAVADDSGLEVYSLGDMPGVHSSRYAGAAKSDRLNMEKLLSTLEGSPPERRTGRFRCAVAIAEKGKLLKVVEGSCEGRIALEAEGSSGFGYDPVFIPKGYKKSFASLGPAVKDRLSHRSKALRKAKRFIEVYLLKGP